MRGEIGKSLRWVVPGLLIACAAGLACSSREITPTAEELQGYKSAASVRAERRAYDGAPPVIGHEDFGMECVACHDDTGVAIEDVGLAPAMPHDKTPNMSGESRCRQCHVFRMTEELFVASSFSGLPQNLRHGGRLHPEAPPTIPHRLFMRENCVACHDGAAAREEVRTTHPERTRCRQCHVAVTTNGTFEPAS